VTLLHCSYAYSDNLCLDITVFSGVKQALRPTEIRECIHALDLCVNLSSFMCSPAPTEAFLPSLQKLNSLHDLRINAFLEAEQTKMLVELKHLRNLTLDNPSWHVVVALPVWAEKLRRSLKSLTLFVGDFPFISIYPLIDRRWHLI
jgi:hypothetical protein